MAVKAMASSACCERCRSEGGNASTLEDAKLAVIRFLAEGGARVRSRADYSLSQLFTQAYTTCHLGIISWAGTRVLYYQLRLDSGHRTRSGDAVLSLSEDDISTFGCL